MKKNSLSGLRGMLSRETPASSTPRWFWEILFIAIGTAISCYFFYPGCLSGDPNFSWRESLYKSPPQFHDWHPPFIAYSWLLLNKLPFQFTPPYANLSVAMMLLFWTGLILAIRPWFSHRALWIIAFLFIGFFPTNIAIISQPIKDSLMTAALLAAYGSLLAAQRQQSRIAFAAGVLCLFLALAYRHNAVFAVLPLALWSGAIVWPRRTWRPQAALGFGIFAGLLLSVHTVNHLLTERSTYPIQLIYTYDLVAISDMTHHIYLPDLYNDYRKKTHLVGFFHPKKVEIQASPLTLDNIHDLHSINVNSVYFYGPGIGLRFLDEEEEITALRNAWIKAVLSEPVAYLEERTTLFLTLLGLQGDYNQTYYCIPPKSTPYCKFMLPQLYSSINKGWLCKAITYFIPIILMLAILHWKCALFPNHLRILGWSAVIHTLSHFPVNGSNDFRYLYWLIPVALIMAASMVFTLLTHKEGAVTGTRP